MLSHLADLQDYFGPLRLLRYITVRTLLAAVTSLTIGFVIAPWLIAKFRELKLGHGYIDDRTGALGATYFDKKNTPTMGGLIIFLSVFTSAALWAAPNIWVFVSLFVYAALTIPGWRDDYLKVVHKNRNGISSWEKIGWQSLATVVALGLLLWHPASAQKIREFWVPFVKYPLIPHMHWAVLLVLIYLWIVGFSNAINLTDGLDGLAIGCTIPVALVFGIMAYVADHVFLSQYLLTSHVPGTGELAVICGALIGGCMAFLWYNCHPAEVFMGDTGSLALGGLIGVMAFMIHQPLTLVIVGGVFVAEMLSVVVQVGVFKITKRRSGVGRRFFLMAPVHHHFQKKGWPETKVVLRFWVLSLGCALAGLATLKLR
ncbi:phospho-N-acetylmuramoyl-pentapeptide-transferase [Opitutus terrae]|uniref:Phospho-N-acetylmuramoyl-pentapeptide-transferase n=1 Tax=Opitutus terrae (strain DSM 11246 / JCM 15787 / PB90-1) TaxID=452637 RepID=MRAY_OPITP|nr:phospho-N-acetylmuramoyl-pentapeptide-transferase [Opitutus terrae]B1ZU32.1 RecName: Full=Phospho-N-acetylmuramoyl-pentapeptide-transferase; AltName: Full=UDP-MurNAc-pentapeptide phosphotransferase [Opitutus terrae PB90-1]ACB75913.1 phospho-N-acetylmuramoyl-pentapeptide-transferase [Opitutus terrae PB90-1]